MHDALRLPRVVSLARFARLAPVLRLAKMRPALLHRAAASNDARAACPVRKHCMFPRLSAGNTALPCHPPWPHVFLARRQRRRRARDALSLPIAVPHRAVRAHLAPAVRLATMRPALLRRAASSNDASAVYPVRKTLSRFAARRAESRAPRSVMRLRPMRLVVVEGNDTTPLSLSYYICVHSTCLSHAFRYLVNQLFGFAPSGY